MNQKEINRLPLGRSSFEQIRGDSAIYVDKSKYVFQLASGKNRIFLSRPRRFGKSLLVSTFESLFKNGLKYFKGLVIEELWCDRNTYKVVHLDFSGINPDNGAHDLPKRLIQHLYPFFRQFGFEFDLDGNLDFYSELELWLKNQTSSSFVLLIDEYDAPLTACLDKPELFELVRSEMSQFYSLVKKCDDAFRFVFITGIAKFAKMSIFSAMNNLSDISLSPQYGAILGYTEDEVQAYFKPFLDNAAKVTNLSADQVLTKMKHKYDGFCFDKQALTHVFSPWSTLKYFMEPDMEFENYWFDSAGQPKMLQKYFKNHSFTDPANYDSEKTISMAKLKLSSGAEDLSELALMTQAGYLTIKNVTPGGVALGYPNEEVAESIAQLYADNLLSGQTLLDLGVPDIQGVLLKEQAENIVQSLNKIFAGIHSRYYEKGITEEDVRMICQVLFKGAKMATEIERANSEGRSDLEVKVGDRHLVFEFKIQRPRRSAKTLLAQAVDQMKLRKYGSDSFVRRQTRIALVFSQTKHQFVAWQEVS